MPRPKLTQSLTNQDEITNILEDTFFNELNINKVSFLVNSSVDRVEYADFVKKLRVKGFLDDRYVDAMIVFINQELEIHYNKAINNIKTAMEKFKLNELAYLDNISEWDEYADELELKNEQLETENKQVQQELATLKDMERYRDIDNRLRQIESKVIIKSEPIVEIIEPQERKEGNSNEQKKRQRPI